MGLINKGRYGMFVACGIWCLADVWRVSPSSEQTKFSIAQPTYSFSFFLKSGRDIYNDETGDRVATKFNQTSDRRHRLPLGAPAPYMTEIVQ